MKRTQRDANQPSSKAAANMDRRTKTDYRPQLIVDADIHPALAAHLRLMPRKKWLPAMMVICERALSAPASQYTTSADPQRLSASGTDTGAGLETRSLGASNEQHSGRLARLGIGANEN